MIVFFRKQPAMNRNAISLFYSWRFLVLVYFVRFVHLCGYLLCSINNLCGYLLPCLRDSNPISSKCNNYSTSTVEPALHFRIQTRPFFHPVKTDQCFFDSLFVFFLEHSHPLPSPSSACSHNILWFINSLIYTPLLLARIVHKQNRKYFIND